MNVQVIYGIISYTTTVTFCGFVVGFLVGYTMGRAKS